MEEDIPIHDEIGIKGLLEAQEERLDLIKFQTRIDNERYLRDHPEIDFIIETFMTKILEERPNVDIIKYAAEFFNKTNFREMYTNKK